MTKRTFLQLLVTIFLCSAARAQQKASPEKLAPPGELEARLKRFFADKRQLAAALVKQTNEPMAPEIQDFLDAGVNGDWKTVAQNYWDSSVVGQTVRECYGAYEQFIQGEEKYVTLFAREILDSMPRGSIYFGGTEEGRCLPAAFCKSHSKGDPVFVITQSVLVDNVYLKYLRAMYGDRITTPTEEDSKKALQAYTAEVEQRQKAGKLRPGEQFKDENGNLAGAMTAIEISARLTRMMFESNPHQEFFIEESFPLEWTYSHLAPHGLILKLHRQPLKELPPETVRNNREYWTRFTDDALGKWLQTDTPVQVVCEFASQVFASKELASFKGDPKFVRNDHVCKIFAKLRSSQAGVYMWRIHNSASSQEKQRMGKEADFALRQAFALCPQSPETVSRYVNLLLQEGRKNEALLVAKTAAKLEPGNEGFATWVRSLEKMK